MNRPAQPCTSPNCCNSSGPRIAGRMPVFLYSQVEGGIAINQYCDSEVAFQARGGVRVRLVLETAYPSDGSVRITVNPSAPCRFPLYLRIPSFAGGARITLEASTPGDVSGVGGAGAYTVLDR